MKSIGVINPTFLGNPTAKQQYAVALSNLKQDIEIKYSQDNLNEGVDFRFGDFGNRNRPPATNYLFDILDLCHELKERKVTTRLNILFNLREAYHKPTVWNYLFHPNRDNTEEKFRVNMDMFHYVVQDVGSHTDISVQLGDTYAFFTNDRKQIAYIVQKYIDYFQYQSFEVILSIEWFNAVKHIPSIFNRVTTLSTHFDFINVIDCINKLDEYIGRVLQYSKENLKGCRINYIQIRESVTEEDLIRIQTILYSWREVVTFTAKDLLSSFERQADGNFKQTGIYF